MVTKTLGPQGTFQAAGYSVEISISGHPTGARTQSVEGGVWKVGMGFLEHEEQWGPAAL